MAFTAGQKLRASDLNAINTAWTTPLFSGTYATGASSGTWATIVGPYNVTVPNGRNLEVEFSAGLMDIPASTGLQVKLTVAGTIYDGGYWSNSGTASFAMPGRLRGVYLGTGASVAILVQAQKVGAGTPTISASSGVGVVILRYRIV